MIRRQSGALLLMVALLLATIAALSFGLNRAAGMDAVSVKSEYDARAAGYLAESAVAAARWANQVKGCTSAAVPVTTFGSGTFEATVKKKASKRLDIVATGTVGVGAGETVRTITRTEVDIVDFNARPTSTDVAGAALDTTITAGMSAPAAASGSASLPLASGSAHALLYWPLTPTELPRDTRVLSATLILTQESSGAARPVAVHRMMTPWDANATWTMANATTNWTGGDYGSTAVASGSTYSLDVTSLVDGWATGRLANYGMLLRLVDPGQSASFYSLNAAKNRPVLRVVTAKAC